VLALISGWEYLSRAVVARSEALTTGSRAL
jgi:hypothetical protein